MKIKAIVEFTEDDNRFCELDYTRESFSVTDSDSNLYQAAILNNRRIQ